MDNFRGAGLMTLAMLCFAIEDMLIKFLAGALPVGQILALLGAGGGSLIAATLFIQGQRLFPRDILSKPVLIRNTGEVIGTVGFVSALVLIPLSTLAAILQTTPLVVTLGAALFLRHHVGWRRWLAILIGLAGVLLIIRPTTEGFDWNVLLALLGVLGLAIRDLATRASTPNMSALQLSLIAMTLIVPTGLFLAWVFQTPMQTPTPKEWGIIAIASIVGAFSYRFIVMAMRVGEISFVTPFRYTRMIFLLIIAVIVFDERPDALTLIGAAIIIASGLYALWRERRLQKTI
ncbi:MAG: DMT family transporter [Silicimonas sp.]|nr:DMT family transporter [Silicimonas sp.]